VPLPLGYEDKGASARIRTAGLPLTRRALLPTELRRPGWDTRFRTWILLGQSQAGLPVPLYPIGAEGGTRSRMPRGLSSRGLPVAFTSAYAARVSNSVPRIKSPVHHQSCLQRVVGMTGLEPVSSGPPDRRSSQTELHPDESRTPESNRHTLLGRQAH
jgi:hypothetical protein